MLPLPPFLPATLGRRSRGGRSSFISISSDVRPRTLFISFHHIPFHLKDRILLRGQVVPDLIQFNSVLVLYGSVTFSVYGFKPLPLCLNGSASSVVFADSTIIFCTCHVVTLISVRATCATPLHFEVHFISCNSFKTAA